MFHVKNKHINADTLYMLILQEKETRMDKTDNIKMKKYKNYS